MSSHTRTVRVMSPDDTRAFQETGREEVHTVEAYEKKIHGENVEPTRSFSTNSYTERRTYGRDENGEMVVKIDKNPREPVRPVSPVRPFGSDGERLLRPIPNFETTPLHIPRVDASRASSHPQASALRHSTLSPATSIHWADQASPRSTDSRSPSGRSSGFGSRPHSASASGGGGESASIAANVPMKKITRKSRMVSIYDGQPVSPYVEKVHFKVADDPFGNLSRYPTNDEQWTFKTDGVVLNTPGADGGHRRERFIPIRNESYNLQPQQTAAADWRSSPVDSWSRDSVIVTENPLFVG